jgi:hypothetical protein
VFGDEECGGAETSESMGELLRDGDRVKLIRDRSQDNRDRFAPLCGAQGQRRRPQADRSRLG